MISPNNNNNNNNNAPSINDHNHQDEEGVITIHQYRHQEITQTSQPPLQLPPPPLFKTPFHARLVNKKHLRYRLYCILMVTAVAVVTLGVLLGIYTREYFIITATIPIGLIIFLVDVFCFYGYEYYLKNNNSNISNNIARHRSSRYCDLMSINNSNTNNDQRSSSSYPNNRINVSTVYQVQQQQNSIGRCCGLMRRVKEEQLSRATTTAVNDHPPRYEDIMMYVADSGFEQGMP